MMLPDDNWADTSFIFRYVHEMLLPIGGKRKNLARFAANQGIETDYEKRLM